jgi:hypothetical protein
MVKEDEMSKAYSKHGTAQECKQGMRATQITLVDQHEPMGVGAVMVRTDWLALDSMWVATTRVFWGKVRRKENYKGLHVGE